MISHWHDSPCWKLLVRFEETRHTDDLDRAVIAFDAMAPGAPGREQLAAMVVNAELRAGYLIRPDRIEHALRLTEIANRHPDPHPQWPSNAAVVRALSLMHQGMRGAAGFSAGSALAQIKTLAGVTAGFEPQSTLVELARMLMRHLQAVQTSDLAEHEALVREVPAVFDRLRSRNLGTAEVEALTSLLVAVSATARGDLGSAYAQLARLRELRQELPATSRTRQRIDGVLARVEPLFAQVLPDVAPPEATGAEDALADVVESPERQALRENAIGVEKLSAARSPAQLSEAIIHLLRAVEVSSATDARRPIYLMSVGTALILRYEMSRQEADLMAGIDYLERARDTTGTLTQMARGLSANPLAHAYRLAGRLELGRRTALDGLRGHAWTALLQSQTVDTVAATRHAAEDALDVAHWCLQDGDFDSAVIALDAGRALTLYAATQTRDLPARLATAGREDLADRIRETLADGDPQPIPADLRHEVIIAMGEHTGDLGGDEGRIFDPPTVHEIRAALGVLGLDGLVYLVPAEGTGHAVIVHAEQPTTRLPLPELTKARLRELRFADVPDSRHTAQLRDMRDFRVRSSLSLADICDWAWSAAMEKVLQYFDSGGDGQLRLALVPMGESARIPWHAASYGVNGKRRYAISRATFSYAVSARLLCEAAWRSAVPLSARGLIVADPDTVQPVPHLPAARAEAQAIREQFYPEARYLGRAADSTLTPDGPGEAAEVQAWLADSEGGALIHLAVHGEAISPAEQAGPTHDGFEETSYLLLAGTPGRLAAESLVSSLTAVKHREVGLAVLAGCRTGEPTRGLDEAFSVGTVLLAAGVRSVISSHWSVPDGATAVLMFLLHHFLRVRNLRPADALREAQLVMVGDRPRPCELPPMLLQFTMESDLQDVLGWAGFFHTGR